jgi:hypothetical protein
MMTRRPKPTKPAPQEISPDPQDYAAVLREHGPLPANASEAEVADRYRDAQAAKLIKLYGPRLRAETLLGMDKVRSRRTKR